MYPIEGLPFWLNISVANHGIITANKFNAINLDTIVNIFILLIYMMTASIAVCSSL